LVLYFYKLKCKIVNIFMSFCINKIKVSKGIDQHPLRSGSYNLYVIAYGIYKLRQVTTALKG
jgi:hypothetical protein